jgi:hypothetical protein
MDDLLTELNSLSNGIASFLESMLQDKKDFGLRTFYAETYSLLLFKQTNKLNEALEKKLIAAYENKNKADSEFHFEFNNYALSEASLLTNNKYDNYFKPLQFKGTKCTNWTLLRETIKIKHENTSTEKLKEKLAFAQLPSGLIQDDPGVHSFQYHCFSAALLYEVFNQTRDYEIKNSFIKAVSFIKNFILKNGDTLYIGRGQEQSFGYGTLIYILAAHYELTNDEESIGSLEKVLIFLKSFQRNDMSFPLVLNEYEPKRPDNVNLQNELFAGWYAYNNYYDYLAFLGCYLKKTEELLKKLNIPEKLISTPESGYSDEIYRKFTTLKYTAVLSKPGGYWTNDQTFPLIYYRNKTQTPCHGGEQFVNSLYGEDQLSFPTLKLAPRKFSWRKTGKAKWIGNNLLWLSLLGFWIKKYKVTNEKLIISTSMFSPFKASDLITLHEKTKVLDEHTLSSNDLKIHCDKKISFYKFGYSAKGKVAIFKIAGNKNTLTVEMK